MSKENNTEEKNIEVRYKRAHLQGWLNQQIVGGKVTTKEAKANFDKNDAKAEKYLEKLSSIRETILAQAKEMSAAE
jgi:hypothetical protein